MLSSNKCLTFADATCAAIDCRKITWEHFFENIPMFSQSWTHWLQWGLQGNVYIAKTFNQI